MNVLIFIINRKGNNDIINRKIIINGTFKQVC